jgi:ribosomal protein S18 acetylase RimI-like enzyme
VRVRAGLDDLMDAAWPAPASQDVDGWRVRFGGGVTRRANSILPRTSPADVEAALREVEAAYGAAGLPPCFQLSPASRPPGLADLLAARGYVAEAPTTVMTGPLSSVAPPAGVTMTDEPDDEWFGVWWSVDGRGSPGQTATARAILTGVPAYYATLRAGDRVAGVGRVVPLGDWAGVYCMGVPADLRGRGHGRTVLAALLAKAAGTAARQAFLAVMDGNAAARALYESAGFTPASSYRYLVRPAGLEAQL